MYVTWLNPMFVIGSNRKEFENQGLGKWWRQYINICSFWHTAIYVSMLVCPRHFPWRNSSILSAIGQTLWSKVPSAVPKTVRPSSCVIQLFTVRDKSSLSFLQDDLGKSTSHPPQKTFWTLFESLVLEFHAVEISCGLGTILLDWPYYYLHTWVLLVINK